MPVPYTLTFKIKPKSASHIAAQSKNSLRWDRHQKNRIAVLDGGMCEWHVRSNTQQRQMPGFVPIFHALYCEGYLRLRNASYFYKALIFCYFLIKQKVREKIYNPILSKTIKFLQNLKYQNLFPAHQNNILPKKRPNLPFISGIFRLKKAS